MKEILDFLTRLAKNNNKTWFDEHKEEYKAIKAKLDAMAIEFMHGIEQFDPRVNGLTIKDITYRIYRDLRFTQDKRPYKTWHGIFVCPQGKKSNMAGYYIHLEPSTATYYICGGMYNPAKNVLKSVREEIMLEGDSFVKALDDCKDFQLPWEEALKRMPAGYSESDAHSEYYRLRSYTLSKQLTKQDVLKKDFIKNALTDLRRTHRFNEILNRCYDYAMEENQ